MTVRGQILVTYPSVNNSGLLIEGYVIFDACISAFKMTKYKGKINGVITTSGFTLKSTSDLVNFDLQICTFDHLHDVFGEGQLGSGISLAVLCRPLLFNVLCREMNWSPN